MAGNCGGLSVTIPPVRAVYGWHADGATDVYLITRTPHGPCLLARWPRIVEGHPPAWDMCRALGTAIEVTSPGEGRRLAEGYERGEDVYPHPAWQQPGRDVTGAWGTPLAARQAAGRDQLAARHGAERDAFDREQG